MNNPANNDKPLQPDATNSNDDKNVDKASSDEKVSINEIGRRNGNPEHRNEKQAEKDNAEPFAPYGRNASDKASQATDDPMDKTQPDKRVPYARTSESEGGKNERGNSVSDSSTDGNTER